MTFDTPRADLAYVRSRLVELYELVDAPEWQPESGRSAPGKHSRPPVAPFEHLPARRVYLDVVAELAQAHQLLGKHTDVPVHWMLRPDTSERAPIVPHSEADDWCIILGGMLDWLENEVLDEQAEQAVEKACEHIGAARSRIVKLWPPHRVRPERPKCLHCADRPAEKQRPGVEAWRKWCSLCRRAHQPDRVRCSACGLGVAS